MSSDIPQPGDERLYHYSPTNPLEKDLALAKVRDIMHRFIDSLPEGAPLIMITAADVTMTPFGPVQNARCCLVNVAGPAEALFHVERWKSILMNSPGNHPHFHPPPEAPPT
jgi:hypothetical protein